MEEKIAVCCNSDKEWFDVEEKAFKDDISWGNGKNHNSWWQPNRCLGIVGKDLGHGGKSFYEDEGYTIISAAEYLNEGGKDVSEFKVGDRARCIRAAHGLIRGEVYTVNKVCGEHIALKEMDPESTTIFASRFKLANKTQTTKENKMNINSSIRTVLVEENGATFETVEKFQKVFGSEIAENFTGAMILRKNIETYNDEIKRMDDIEAKRLEQEETAAKD